LVERVLGKDEVTGSIPVNGSNSEFESFCRGVIAMPREIITFQCSECKNRNYSSTKNKKTKTERLELKKFCRHCHKHQPHREIK
jgi:large subunit ribosomal protein L33